MTDVAVIGLMPVRDIAQRNEFCRKRHPLPPFFEPRNDTGRIRRFACKRRSKAIPQPIDVGMFSHSKRRPWEVDLGKSFAGQPSTFKPAVPT
jgi:hypothetical protein